MFGKITQPLLSQRCLMVLCYIAMEAVARLVGCFTYKTRRFWDLQTRSIYQSQRVTGSLGSDFGRRFPQKPEQFGRFWSIPWCEMSRYPTTCNPCDCCCNAKGCSQNAAQPLALGTSDFELKKIEMERQYVYIYYIYISDHPWEWCIYIVYKYI